MTTSKKQILDSGSVTDQEALVKRLLGPTGPRIIKRTIPAGKTMLSQIDKASMKDAVYNWLRGCGGFSEVTISFAKEPHQWVVGPTKVQSFDTRDTRPIWTRTAKGRKDLAESIAKLINDTTRRIIYITAKPDGLYIGEDKKGLFHAKVVVDENNSDQYPGKEIGDKVPSVDWEPYIEFIATNRSPYTDYSPKEASHV